MKSQKTKLTLQVNPNKVKASCGKRGCYITLLPTSIRRENLEEFKKAS
jgi:hypothetical protein